MLTRGAFIHYSTLPHLGLKAHKLFISALVCLSLGNSHHLDLQFGVQEFEQVASTNRVDQHRAVDRPPHKGRAIALPADRTSRAEPQRRSGRS